TLMVTSALKGEGKTSLACHLATSLARAGRCTLLLDCDFRSPSAHHVLDAPLMPGLCELLRGEANLGDAIRPTATALLSLIPAGRCDSQAIEALAQDDLRDLFLALRERFDFIIVDSAPALLVSDSLMISQHVDAVLFSILRDVSRVPKVHAAYERLTSIGARICGAVLAGAAEEATGYDYHYLAQSASADRAARG